MGLDKAVQLLHHHQPVHAGGQVADLLNGHGPDHAQLEHGIPVAADLFHILIRGGGGDDAHGLVRAVLQTVDVCRFGPFRQGGGALLHNGVAALCVAGHHDVLGGGLFIGFADLGALAALHHTLGVGDAGAHFQQHGGVILLRQVIGQLGHGQRLGGIGRLQHGDLGGTGIVPAVLLVLGAVHAGVVGHADDHAAVDTGVGNGEQGVRGHVQAHVLHAAEGALAGQGRAEGGFHGHLFIGGPFGVHLGIFGDGLGDLSAGGAGIAGYEAASGLKQAPGNGFVAQHQRFHGEFLLFR